MLKIVQKNLLTAMLYFTQCVSKDCSRMSYEYFIDVTGYDTNPKEFLTSLDPDLLFSDIFTGLPQLYAGSSFVVEEILELYLDITKLELLDIDLLWYPPKYYLGTWSLFSQLSVFGTNPENRGFIEDFITQITRYSTYTIQANADVPIALHELTRLDNCNFLLNDVAASIPPFELGQLYPVVNEGILIGSLSLSNVPLIDQPFNRKIKTFGIATRPGCICTGAKYKCRVINAISVDLEPFPVSSCNIYPAQTCNGLYANRIADVNAIPNTSTFVTQAEGLAQIAAEGLSGNQYQFGADTFVCPIEPYTQYTFWVLLRTGNQNIPT